MHSELLSDAMADIERLDTRRQVEAVGVNCSPPAIISGVLATMRAHTDRALLAYPNSGERWDAAARCWRDSADARAFDERAVRWFEQGCCAVGGCCRVLPSHIRAVRRALVRKEARRGGSWLSAERAVLLSRVLALASFVVFVLAFGGQQRMP